MPKAVNEIVCSEPPVITVKPETFFNEQYLMMHMLKHPPIESISGFYDDSTNKILLRKDPHATSNTLSIDKLCYTLNHEFVHYLLYKMFDKETTTQFDNIWFCETLYTPPPKYKALYKRICKQHL